MIAQGLLLLVAGTGTVFVFLSLMILVMMAVGKYYKANESRFAEALPGTRVSRGARVEMGPVIAAIAVGLQRKRP
jgi:Na+-transporting methylmalonyl-CoA/oxaloacetate decarboxylase gamma subunit